MRLLSAAGLLLALALLAPGRAARAQRPDTLRPPTDTLRPRPRPDTARAPARPARVDTLGGRGGPRVIGTTQPVGFVVQPPISPRRAFLYSALLPGLGQTRLRRPNVGAFFAAVELSAIVMARKTSYDVEEAKTFAPDSIVESYELNETSGALTPVFAYNRYSTRVRSRRTQLEDWISVLVFNHLIAGAEAFVAAQLWDLPSQVSVRQAPAGGVAVSASLAW